MNPERMEQYRAAIESYLLAYTRRHDQEPQHWLFDAMGYSLLAGGKRLRPIFTLEFCRISGGNWKAALPFAGAVEMVQTYSLIHDDLPSMDNDDYRRGKLTNHKVYGEGMAILAGDALLTAAFQEIATARDISPEARIRAVEVLSRCAGETGMVGGQVLDIMSEQRQCNEQEILDIQTRKTGALIQASCILGVLAGGGTPQQEAAAGEFAHHLGLAFQIRDDMLDVIGDAAKLGKATGADEGKNTFVRLYGLEACERLVKHHTDLAIRALEGFEQTEFLKDLAINLTCRDY